MIPVEVLFEVDGQPVLPETIEDDYELAQTLEHTGESARQGVQHKLRRLELAEGEPTPTVLVTVMYERETGQMELNYHVENCAGITLLKVVQALNH